jgi:hypothetical protein
MPAQCPTKLIRCRQVRTSYVTRGSAYPVRQPPEPHGLSILQTRANPSVDCLLVRYQPLGFVRLQAGIIAFYTLI